MLQYPKKNQLCTRIVNHNDYNFWTTKYLIMTLFYWKISLLENCVVQCNIFNDLIFTMKSAFPMLCAHSPSVHSYNVYIILFSKINIPVSQCFFNNSSLFLKSVNSISHVSATTTVNKTICLPHLWYQLKWSLTNKHTKISIFWGKCLFVKISKLTTCTCKCLPHLVQATSPAWSRKLCC